MKFAGVVFRRRLWSVVALLFCVLPEAQAALRGFMPLAHSGQVAYRYGYVENAGSQSESTGLLIGWNASGYVWRPWFATTSMALTAGLTNTETNTSSSEGTVGTGSYSLSVFPRSRFPFSLMISRTDSRSEQYQDLTLSTGSSSFRVTRLSLRQSYRPRSNNQLYNAFYYSTKYDAGASGSNAESYGLDYTRRIAHQSMGVGLSHSASKNRGAVDESTSDVVSLSHVYTPNAELGVNSLFSYVEVDPAGKGGVSTDSQAFSSFAWRPEHRSFSVSGGVRLAESKSEGATTDSVSRSLNTNIGLGYRATRSLTLNANASVGSTDSGGEQTLLTTQTVSVSFTGSQRQWAGYRHTWNWGASAGNSTSHTEEGATSTDTDRQSVSAAIAQNLSKTWAIGQNSSLSGSFSQSAGGNKSSDADLLSKTVSHGVSLSWNARGKRGSNYVSARVNDSRSFSEQDTVFNSFSLTYSGDMVFSRLSNISGNANYQASQNETEDELGETITGGSRSLSGSLDYRHNRPFGIYNLRFSAGLQGSKQIDSATPSTSLQARSTFSYALGRLSTSLGFRISESAGGTVSKSMNFQATRSF